MDFTIPDEYKMLKSLAKDFIEKEIRPWEKEMEEKKRLPEDVWNGLVQKSKAVGLLAPFAPMAWGGGGIESWLARVLVGEEQGTTLDRFEDIVGGYHGGAYIYFPASDYQIERYWKPYVRGECSFFAAITEPTGGSDQRAMKTTAKKKGANWVINGSKCFVGIRPDTRFGYVWAVVDAKTGATNSFIVEVGQPGFTIGKEQPKMGRHGVPVHELYFDDCVVPEINQAPGERGIGQFQRFIQLPRLHIGALAVGGSQYCLDKCIEYAKQRETFGKPLSRRQAIQWMLVDTWMEIECVRTFVYRAACKVDNGETDIRAEAAAAKVLGSELACRVADRAIQIHGGFGYTTDLPFERVWRDFRATRIFEGGNEVMKLIMARWLLKEHYAVGYE